MIARFFRTFHIKGTALTYETTLTRFRHRALVIAEEEAPPPDTSACGAAQRFEWHAERCSIHGDTGRFLECA
jgi:hypothetical protein